MSVAGLEHVLVLTSDLERAREFYERGLGLRVGARPPLGFSGYWLYARDTPCLHIADRASYRAHAQTLGLDVPASPQPPGPVDHIAFAADDYDDVDRRLSEFGIEPVRNDVPGDGPRQLFFDDPDGVRVEVNVKAPTIKAGRDD